MILINLIYYLILKLFNIKDQYDGLLNPLEIIIVARVRFPEIAEIVLKLQSGF